MHSLVDRIRLERRSVLHATAALIPVFAIADALANGGHFAAKAFALRLCWSAVLLGCAFGIREASARAARARLIIAAVTSSLFYVGITATVGGSGSPLFAWGLVVPVAIGALLQEELEAVVVASLASLGAALGLLAYEHQPGSALAIWLILYVASAVVAVLASVSFRRLREAEKRELTAQHQLARSEQRRVHAERLAVVGQLAAGVAHEVRNPLQLAMLQLDLLRSEKLSKNADERSTSVLRSLERISQIVNDLRGFSLADREGTGFEEVALKELVDETLRLAEVRLTSVAKVTSELPPDLPRVRVQRRQMSQVLLNLLMNAADALEERRMEQAQIRISASAEEGAVRLLMDDNGPGIPTEVLPHIFEPFFTTKDEGKGTGLGLALSREYVERFGGTLTAENLPSGGARFVIQLPAAQACENKTA